MVPTPDKLPVMLMLAGFVFIFFYTQKHTVSRPIRLWYLGWVALFLHSVIQVWQSMLAAPSASAFGLAMAMNFLFLTLPAIFFWLAVSMLANDQRSGWPLALFVGLPASVYVVLLGFGITARPIFLLIIAVVVLSELSILYLLKRPVGYVAADAIAVAAGGVGAAYQVWRGHPEIAFLIFLSVVFGFAAIHYRRWQPRLSAAAVTTTTGFLLWAAVPPLIYLTSANPLLALASSSLWNLPAFLVAIGIIVTLLDERTRAAAVVVQRQGALNIQMMRFAELTSQLLGGAELGKFCEHVAAVIAEASEYSQVLILLADDAGKFQPCGFAGISSAGIRFLKPHLAGFGVRELNLLCEHAPRVGPNSFAASLIGELRSRAAASADAAETAEIRGELEKLLPAADDPSGRLVPLRAPNTNYLGCIVLRRNRSGRPGASGLAVGEKETLASIELLATDLAIAKENSNLQQHLLRSERLAGIGQLVSGVAHELNNPLTAVMGYTEMLLDRVGNEKDRRELDIVQREALRMKNIIQNLLSFARQSKPQPAPVDLAIMLDDILKLRAYHLRSHHIIVETVLPETMPVVMADESLIKQVFMNVLKNAEEAVDKLPEKHIEIKVLVESETVQIQFQDHGPGFSNLDRAFDPFFTTKGPTEGTGLGLSICYGIVKEMGGEITAYNLQPNGGCVAIELPVHRSFKGEPAAV